MDIDDFLFPRALTVTEFEPKNILILGSCLSEAYAIRFRKLNENTNIDHIFYNNASDLPLLSTEKIQSYDLIYVQIPLRTVITDAVARRHEIRFQSEWLELRGHAENVLINMLNNLFSVTRGSNVPILVSNFIVPQSFGAPSLKEIGTDFDLNYMVAKINGVLAQRVATEPNSYVADVDALACSFGKSTFLDDSIVFSSHNSVIYPDWSGHEALPYWSAPLPGRIDALPDLNSVYEIKEGAFFKCVYRQIFHMYRIIRQIDQVKLVIFDLDNTLWRGQLIEHYAPGSKWPYSDGWPLGIWEAVNILRQRGIIVSLCSKNDEVAVKSNWSNAVNIPFLGYEDFVYPQIGWGPKPAAIAKILDFLSITDKSVVFVDDNPVERDAVKSAFPKMRVIGSNPFETRRILLWASETQLAERSDEAKAREQTYRGLVVREEDRRILGQDDFLKSLGVVVTIFALNQQEERRVNRSVELLNKTNQFNTRRKKWTVGEFLQFLAAGGRGLCFEVKDKYNNYGLTGVIVFDDRNLFQWAMSCRVLGMGVEAAVLLALVKEYFSYEDMRPVTAELEITEYNTPCRDLYTKCGFTLLNSGETEGQPLIFESAGDFECTDISHVQIEYPI